MKLYWWPHPVRGYYVIVAADMEQARKALTDKFKNMAWNPANMNLASYVNDCKPAVVEVGDPIYLG